MVRAIDLHQHLWPEQLVEELRRRDRTPYLRGWTVHVDGEPPYRADPADHEVAARIAADREVGVDLACVSLSSPLGIEELPPEEARPLLDVWHEGTAALPEDSAHGPRCPPRRRTSTACGPGSPPASSACSCRPPC